MMKDLWTKIKGNRGKIGAGVLASVVGANIFDFNPTFVNKVTEAKQRLEGSYKKVVKEIAAEAKRKGHPVDATIKPAVTPEDMTASEFVGVTVYIEGERKRLTLSIEQRDKLLGIFDDVEYIKREGNASQVEVLLMLDCQSKFGENETLYERCLDLVFEDFQSGEEK